MQVRPHGPDGHAERTGDLLIAPLLLMIKDENRSFDLAKPLKLLLDALLELPLLNLLLGVSVRMLQAVLPTGEVVRDGHQRSVVASSAFPFVLRHINGNPVKIRRNKGFAAKARQCAIEPEEDLLREIVEMFAASSKAQKGAEDHRLMVAHHLLEAEIGVQAELDNSVRRKFHPCQ